MTLNALTETRRHINNTNQPTYIGKIKIADWPENLLMQSLSLCSIQAYVVTAQNIYLSGRIIKSFYGEL